MSKLIGRHLASRQQPPTPPPPHPRHTDRVQWMHRTMKSQNTNVYFINLNKKTLQNEPILIYNKTHTTNVCISLYFNADDMYQKLIKRITDSKIIITIKSLPNKNTKYP